MLNNLIKIENLSKEEILKISDLAFEYKNEKKEILDKNIALMFFENSTRTKISFEMAAKNLGMNVVNFNVATSSINKGESLKDTIENLYFIGINAVVIRTREENLFQNLMKELSYPMTLINAGSGKNAHPSQALLDFVTMREKIGNLENKKIAIIGDIEHSRVARSNISLLNKFGAKITICAPDFFKPKQEINAVNFNTDLVSSITDADVVMLLRIQKERIDEIYSEKEYINKYQLNSQILKKYAPNAILMHPGPVNREVEITSELLDSDLGKTILEQAQNGVYTRMAILKYLLGEQK